MTATAARPTFRTHRARHRDEHGGLIEPRHDDDVHPALRAARLRAAALDAEIAAAERTADKAARAAREALARVNDLRAQRDRLTRADRAVAVAACTPGE